MSADLFKSAAKFAASAVLPSVASLIYDVAAASIKKSKEIADEGDLEKLKVEAVRQELENRIAEYQARVAQELAIARRIESAQEVEIEEFYDVSGEGNLGVNVKDGVFNLGAAGSGRKVTSRIYRFTGFDSSGVVENYQQKIDRAQEE